jgi:hypothetical protein
MYWTGAEVELFSQQEQEQALAIAESIFFSIDKVSEEARVARFYEFIDTRLDDISRQVYQNFRADRSDQTRCVLEGLRYVLSNHRWGRK